MLLELLLTLWVSLLLALSYVFVRDVRSVYQMFLRILFVATPIFYAPSLLGEAPPGARSTQSAGHRDRVRVPS